MLMSPNPNFVAKQTAILRSHVGSLARYSQDVVTAIALQLVNVGQIRSIVQISRKTRSKHISDTSHMRFALIRTLFQEQIYGFPVPL